jgi:hypothetical protein
MGKIITTIPTLILIVIVMGVFIGLSIAASTMKDSKIEPANLVTLPENNLLLQTIEVEFEGEVKKMLVYDVLNLIIKHRLDLSEVNLHKILSKLLNEEKNCYYLNGMPGQYNFNAWKYNPTQQIEDYRDHDGIEEASQSKTFTDDKGTEITVRHYFGRCPNEL